MNRLLKPNRRELTKHSTLVRGGRDLVDSFRSVSEVAACYVGVIRRRVSSRRGVVVTMTQFEVMLKVHADDGVQEFHLTPRSGYTLDQMFDVAIDRISRKFEILERRVPQLEEGQKVRMRAENVAAYQFLLESSTIGADGKRRVTAPSRLLKDELHLGQGEANSALASLTHKGLLVAESRTKSKGRSAKTYIVKEVELEASDVVSSDVRGDATVTPEAAIAVLGNRPKLAIEALECLSIMRLDAQDSLQRVIDEIENQRDDLIKQADQKTKEIAEKIEIKSRHQAELDDLTAMIETLRTKSE